MTKISSLNNVINHFKIHSIKNWKTTIKKSLKWKSFLNNEGNETKTSLNIGTTNQIFLIKITSIEGEVTKKYILGKILYRVE